MQYKGSGQLREPLLPDFTTESTEGHRVFPFSTSVPLCALCGKIIGPASHNLTNHLAEVPFEAFVAGDFEVVGVHAHLVQERGVDVRHVMRTLHRVEAEFVGSAVGDAAFDPPAGHPDAEAVRVMVAPVRAL